MLLLRYYWSLCIHSESLNTRYNRGLTHVIFGWRWKHDPILGSVVQRQNVLFFELNLTWMCYG